MTGGKRPRSTVDFATFKIEVDSRFQLVLLAGEGFAK